MLHPEWLVLVGYIDSLFVERTERAAKPSGTIPETLNRLYLQAMRYHAREAALLFRQADRWDPMPDWRFDRHVIRIALYLQERIGVGPGDRVAIVSELSPEWLVADLAALTLGAVSVAVDPSLPSDRLVGALVDAGPKVVFASATGLGKLDGGALALPGLTQVVGVGPGAQSEDSKPFAEVLELGGTLDTPERAQIFRASARATPTDHPAICHHDPSVEGRVVWQELTQAQAIERIEEFWRAEPANEGDLAYLAAPGLTLGVRLRLYAGLGDGYTTTALGTPGGAVAELAELRPQRIVAAPAMLADAVHLALARQEPANGNEGWRERARRIFARAEDAREQRALRDTLGGRVRAISPTGPLDPAVVGRLRSVAAVGPEID